MAISHYKLILADQLADLLPPGRSASGSEWQFQIFTVRAHMGRLPGRSTPLVLASSGQEWQFYISIVRVHICRSTGRSTPTGRSASGSELQFHIFFCQSAAPRTK